MNIYQFEQDVKEGNIQESDMQDDMIQV